MKKEKKNCTFRLGIGMSGGWGAAREIQGSGQIIKDSGIEVGSVVDSLFTREA
jgi:hypothetical protein